MNTPEFKQGYSKGVNVLDCHGFRAASEYAKSIGAVQSGEFRVRDYVISLHFFNKNLEEVCLYHPDFNTTQTFIPPRRWGIEARIALRNLEPIE